MELKQPVHNILIFGDSYSTYEGYIPDGYAVYYRNVDCDNTDVRLVEETWWHRLCQRQKLDLVRNDSWSGSTIGNTGYNGDCSHSNSFLYRLEQLQEAQFFDENDIDTVFIFGGTNDSWSNAPLGADKKPPYTEEDLFCVCPAIWTFIERLQQTLPDANIISLINTELKPEIGACIRTASEHFGTAYITLYDIHKCCGHPTIQGMQDICDQVEAFLFDNEPIENQIIACLSFKEAEIAIAFVAFLREKGLTFHRDRSECWREKRYYWVKDPRTDKCVCYIAIADPDEPAHHFTVWSDDNDVYANAAVSPAIRDVAYAHVDTCGCCGGGKTKVIFGKTFASVCDCTFRIDDPTAAELPFLETMVSLCI